MCGRRRRRVEHTREGRWWTRRQRAVVAFCARSKSRTLLFPHGRMGLAPGRTAIHAGANARRSSGVLAPGRPSRCSSVPCSSARRAPHHAGVIDRCISEHIKLSISGPHITLYTLTSCACTCYMYMHMCMCMYQHRLTCTTDIRPAGGGGGGTRYPMSMH